jgi:hypothetical protein
VKKKKKRKKKEERRRKSLELCNNLFVGRHTRVERERERERENGSELRHYQTVDNMWSNLQPNPTTM